MSNIDKQALLRAAVKIGAERWRSSGDSVITDDYHDGEKVCFDEVAECRRTEGKPLYAEFIAAANPATVLALLDELEDAEKRISELTEKPIGWTHEQELRDVEKLGCGYLFNANPITPHADPRRVILLYAAAAGKGAAS